MTNPPRDHEDHLLVVYVLGELDEAARWQLEQRLAGEPELAARLVGLEALDLVGATLLAADAGKATAGKITAEKVTAEKVTAEKVTAEKTTPGGTGADRTDAGTAPRAEVRSRGLPAWMLVLAAAAVAAWLLWPAPDAIACDVRAVATAGFDDVGVYADALGLPRPVGAQRDASTPAPAMPVADFLVAAEGREHARSEAALAAPAAPVVAEFFTLRLRVDRECSAVVLQLDAAGGLARRFPARAEVPLFGEAGDRLTAGPIHVLPRAVAVANRIGALSLHPGFDVPSDVRPRRTWMLVALRVEATGAPFFAELDRYLARDGSMTPAIVDLPPAEQEAAAARRIEAVRAWLRVRGFTTHSLIVDGG